MTFRVLLHRVRTRAHRRGCDRGDTSIQMVICFPAALLLLFMVVTACNIYLAQQAAQTAAREGVQGARGYGSGTEAGLARAQSVLDRLHGTLTGTRISADGSTGERIQITVTGTAQNVLGLPISVTEHASGPVEKWIAP
ncbi:Flp pilus assembly protein TadG [Kitasatospora sp. MAP12-15]|uniref:TadE/TadG family type IV pilus assembly protein n=1 Tax=unclassified Kitasatospora TaxID=2633591 RepID=UPI002473744C|nr:TadE/TadG family type IV pilus assembly protein [Kitasatospora sp. MAP12-44]MDH6115643.1 Flp pilus assembly protein TadG [Kitasatospora sp. MAP12-44]